MDNFDPIYDILEERGYQKSEGENENAEEYENPNGFKITLWDGGLVGIRSPMRGQIDDIERNSDQSLEQLAEYLDQEGSTALEQDDNIAVLINTQRAEKPAEIFEYAEELVRAYYQLDQKLFG